MKPELQIFTTCDYEPFAVFYWGTEGYGLTKEKAIDEYRQFVDDEIPEDECIASEPHLFYLCEELDEDGNELADDEDFPWNKCSADHPRAEACFGVVFG